MLSQSPSFPELLGKASMDNQLPLSPSAAAAVTANATRSHDEEGAPPPKSPKLDHQNEEGYRGPFADMDFEIPSSQEDFINTHPLQYPSDVIPLLHQPPILAEAPSTGPLSPNPPPPKFAARNLEEIVKYYSKKPTEDLEGMDILQICAKKGIIFDSPRWWRPGGYDK